MCECVYVYIRVGVCDTTDVCLIRHLTKDESKRTKHFFLANVCVCVCVRACVHACVCVHTCHAHTCGDFQ